MNDDLKKVLKEFSILYVEDEVSLLKMTMKLFKKLFKSVDTAIDGEIGLELYKKNNYDIVITDVNMPKIDGLEMSKKIKEINPFQIIIISSAHSDSDKLLETIKLGIDGYIIKPIELDKFFPILEKSAQILATKKENEYYKNNLKKLVIQKVKENKTLEAQQIKNYEDTILALVNMIEIRDSYTSGHSLRVAQYSVLIGKKLGFDEEELHKLYQAGILHDIGKIAVPDSILLKPTSLDKQEYSLMQKHALMSYEILNKIPMYKDLSIAVKYHHERFDGSGYPEGLKENEIPLHSQIMAIADTFDAITTSRIYKPRKDKKDAINELQGLSGVSFSSELLKNAIEVLKELVIDTSISQEPLSEFEEQRFSYFYKDKLTNIYNGEYLELVLNKNSYEKKHHHLSVVFLHKFSLFNQNNSWEKGDEVLKMFAKYLKDKFIDSLIFRFRGDDFVILNSMKKEIDFNYLKEYKIDISVVDINLNNIEISSYLELKEYLDELEMKEKA